MSRLDEAIAELTYILDCLRVLKNIWESGNCNECEKKRTCKYVPYPGEQVRYNCPHFEEEVKSGALN